MTWRVLNFSLRRGESEKSTLFQCPRPCRTHFHTHHSRPCGYLHHLFLLRHNRVFQHSQHTHKLRLLSQRSRPGLSGSRHTAVVLRIPYQRSFVPAQQRPQDETSMAACPLHCMDDSRDTVRESFTLLSVDAARLKRARQDSETDSHNINLLNLAQDMTLLSYPAPLLIKNISPLQLADS